MLSNVVSGQNLEKLLSWHKAQFLSGRISAPIGVKLLKAMAMATTTAVSDSDGDNGNDGSGIDGGVRGGGG